MSSITKRSVANLINNSCEGIDNQTHSRWERKDQKSYWKGDQNRETVLKEMAYAPVATVVATNVSCIVHDHSFKLSLNLHGRLVDELVGLPIRYATCHNLAFVICWIDVYPVEQNTKDIQRKSGHSKLILLA